MSSTPDDRGTWPGDGAAGDEPSRAEVPEADAADAQAVRRTLERERAIARRQAREADRELGAIRDELTTTRKRLAHLAGRRSVRLTVAIVDRGKASVARLRGLGRRRQGERPDGPDGAGLAASDADLAAFEARLRAARVPGTPRTSGPLVSIVMLNRNGEVHLRRCLPALAETAYRELELIVVDNGSEDESRSIVRAFRPPFPVRLIENENNASFSDGNNQGIAASQGELVLLLNNDIEPIHPSWLGYLVDTVLDNSVAAGARLVYPPRGTALRAGLRFPDLSLQHGGVSFVPTDGVPFPAPMRPGTDALADWASEVREAPALTAACLLVRRSDLDRVGGFSAGYVYGQEDVDLCLKLRSLGGRLMYDGRAVLWHHESATRELGDPTANRERVRANRDRFVGTWAPRLYRTVMLDSLAGSRAWRDEPLRVGLDRRPDQRQLTDALAHLAWRIGPSDPGDEIDPAIDVLVALDDARDVRSLPTGIVRVAWVHGAPEPWLTRPWFDDFDIVACSDPAAIAAIERASSQRARQVAGLTADALGELLAGWLEAARIGIQTAVPSWEVAEAWGDLHLARGLQRALRRLDHPSRIYLLPDAPGWAAARDDATIHLYGLAATPTRPGRIDVLWHISHPDRVSPELYERFDRVFVASDGFARWMADRVDVPVAALHQATDPERFRPEPTGPAHELLLVANSRGTRRHILDDLLPTRHELAVYGRGWTPERLDPAYLAGDTIPNQELGGYYAAASIVLNDHWTDMQREGFLSNRLYDASAAGGFVISDDIAGLDTEFDAGIVAYRDPADLGRLIDHYLAHPDERRARARRARAAVLARHTFDHRARSILDVVDPLLAGRPRLI